MITRRQLLRNASTVIGLGSPLLSSLGLGCRRSGNDWGDSIHEQIAKRATQVSRKGSSLTVMYPQGCLANLEPIVREFKQLTAINIKLNQASLDGISTEVIMADQLGPRRTPFDVALPPTFSIPDLVEAGAIENLDAFAAEHAEHTQNVLRSKPSSIYTQGDRYKGSLYGYQTDGDAYTMFYNGNWHSTPELRKRYEDQHGKALAIPKTWTDLDRQMEFFNRPDDSRFGGSLFRTKNYIAWEFWIRLHAKGLYPVADDMEPRFATEQSQAALKELIAASRHLEPASGTNGLFENFSSYAKGNKYANIGWGGTQKFLNGPDSALRGGVLHGEIPGGTIKGQTVTLPYFNWGWNFVVSSKSSQTKLAYLFILFATSPKISTFAVRQQGGYFDPYRIEHFADPMIQTTYGNEFLQVHQKSLVNCLPDFYLRGQGRYFSALQTAVHEANLGRLSPETALEAASVKWNKITDELGRESQAQQWKFLKESYPAKLQKLLA